MAVPSKQSPDSQAKSSPKKRLLLFAAIIVPVALLAILLLNAPMPVPPTVNEVHSWPVPKQTAMDLLKTDWFKEAQFQPPQTGLSQAQINQALSGCWKYRNGRLNAFDGSFTIRSVDPASSTVKGFWNYDKGQPLPLKGDYKIDGSKQVIVSLANSTGAAFGRDLILRKNQATPCLCAAKSDPYAGLAFRALKTSEEMRPTAPTINEPLQPLIISLLYGRWHGAAAAPGDSAPSFEIDRVFDDGTFSIKDAPRDGGFVSDGDVVSLFLGDRAYSQLSAAQDGAEITLNAADESHVFTKDPGQAPHTGKSGSVLSGIYNLIQQRNQP